MKIPSRSTIGKYGGPLLSTREAAAEFGVTITGLNSLLMHRDGPKPERRTQSRLSGTRESYFVPRELRTWWSEWGGLTKEEYKKKRAAATPPVANS